MEGKRMRADSESKNPERGKAEELRGQLADSNKGMGNKLIFEERVGSEQVGSCMDRWPELRDEQIGLPKNPFVE